MSDIHPAVQAQLDKLQAEIDRQRSELAADREDRERQQAAKTSAPAAKAKRSLCRPAPRVNPYDAYDEANPDDPDDSFARRWAESALVRDQIEMLDRTDLEAIARRVGVEHQWIPAAVVECLHHVRRDPGGWRAAPKADYLEVADLEKVMRRAVKKLEAADEEPPTASPLATGGYDYSAVLPRRRSGSDDLVTALFGDDDSSRRHAQGLAHTMAAEDERRAGQEQARQEADAKPLNSGEFLAAVFGGR
jgi:hypothetical protein